MTAEGKGSYLGESLRYGAPLAVLAGATALAAFFLPLVRDGRAAQVANALALDFTVTFPLLVYLLLVRSKRLPWIVLVPAFAAGYGLAAATLPAEHRWVLSAMEWLLLPAEAGLVVWLVILTRRAIRSRPHHEGDAATRFRGIAREVLGRRIPADILATEVLLLYYAFRRRRQDPERTGGYTLHREAAYLNVLIGLGFVMVIEIFAAHVLLRLWSPVAAWILTGLSLYAIVWLIGDLRAITSRRVRITQERLEVRLGLRWEADVPIDEIEEVEPLDPPVGKAGRDVLTVALLGQANTLLTLRKPAEVTGMYGLRRVVKGIRLRVDDSQAFREELARRLTTRQGTPD